MSEIKGKLSQTLPTLIRFVGAFSFFLILFLGARMVFMFTYAEPGIIGSHLGDIVQAFITGFRFDGVVLAYALLPFLLISLASIFLAKWSGYRSLSIHYLSFCLFFLLFILVSDFQFYKFFQSHFNLLVFGFFQDDTWAVTRSIWIEHPVIWILIFLTLSVYSSRKAFAMIMDAPIYTKPGSLKLNIFILLIFIGLYILTLRGSVGTFPLEKDDSVISSNQWVNTLTMNGVFALKDAIEDRNHYAISTDTSKTFSNAGFGGFQEAVQYYFDLPEVPDFNKALEHCVGTTAQNPVADSIKPHVIFIQMESMSNWYLNLHSKNFNLLGELENQLPECYLFRDFTSIRNGTIHTLEGLMVNTPLTPLSQSQYLKTSFSTSAARPYHLAGYETRFVTGAKLGWRNLDKFVSEQYFMSAEGSASLLEKVEGAEACEWGVFDEFMFDYLNNYLQHAKKPQFIFAMSTTNHTPFELPNSYQPHPINIGDSLSGMLRCGKEIAIKNFTNYQYANDALGNFIKKVRESPIGHKTIIAASGDHNTLQTLHYPDEQTFQKVSVPLILYIPPMLRPKADKIHGFASQRDIFPTLYQLSLSKAKYAKAGISLFDSSSIISHFAINDFNLAFSKEGMADLTSGINKSWKSHYEPVSIQWPQNQKRALMVGTMGKETKLDLVLRKAKAYTAIMTYLIQRECAGKPLLFDQKP